MMQLLICIYAIASAVLFLSGQAFDSTTLLTQPLVFSLSSTSIVSLLYSPLRILNALNASLAGVIVIVISSCFVASCYKKYFLNIHIGKVKRLQDLSIFLPFIYFYLVLPSKEQAFAVAFVLLFSRLVFMMPAQNYYHFFLAPLQIATLSLVLVLCRPVSILLLPLVFIVSSTLNSISHGKVSPINYRPLKISGIKIVVFRVKPLRLLRIMVLSAAVVALFLSADLLYGSIRQIFFQTSYETGNTSSLLLDSKAINPSEINVWDLARPWLVTILAGYPYLYAENVSIGSIFISIAYCLAFYFVVIPAVGGFARLLLWSGYTLPEILLVLAPAILAFIMSTAGLLLNSGTGIRYFGNFFFCIWLMRFLCDRIILRYSRPDC